jgi:hypothetical protein
VAADLNLRLAIYEAGIDAEREGYDAVCIDTGGSIVC